MQGKLKTVSGPIVTVNDALARNAKSLVVNFAPIQADGTPSPDNVLPISGWTGVTGYRTGKNLIDPAQKTVSATVARWYQADGYLLRAGKTYTLTSDISGTVYVISKATATVLSQGNDKTSYTPTNDTLVYFQWYASSGSQSVVAMLTIDDTSPVFTPYSGTTYTVTFPAVGKNLWDENSVEYANEHTYIGGSNGVLATTVSDVIATKGFIPCSHLQGETVTLNKRCGGSAAGIAFYSQASESAFISGYANGGVAKGTPWTFQIPQNANYMRLTLPLEHTEIQIEFGSTSTAYEPYTNTIYGGYVDLVSGVLVAEWGMVDLGTLTWKQGVNYTTRYSTLLTFGNVKQPSAGTKANAICDAYNVAKTPTYMQENTLTSGEFCIGRPGVNTLFMQNDSYNDAASFKASLNGTKLVYELSTPITYQLTPQTIAMLKGTNNVWANTNGNVELTYYAQ